MHGSIESRWLVAPRGSPAKEPLRTPRAIGDPGDRVLKLAVGGPRRADFDGGATSSSAADQEGIGGPRL